MATDKRINYNVQGNVKNYLGKQKIVKAPLHWQSSPDHPTTELAYITKKEKDLLIKKDLHKSLKGGVNRGPSGIMSLNGWGDRDEGFADKSYGGQERSVTSTVPGGGTKTTTVSPKDTFAQSWTGPKRFFGLTGGYRDLKVPGDTSQGHRSRIGGIGRGLLSLLGGIPGRVASGLMTAKNWATRAQPTIEEEEDITSDYRINPTTGQYEYVGGSMEDTMKEFRQKYPVDLRTNVGGTNQNYKTALGEGWATNYTGADTNNDFMPQNFNMALPIGSAEGGRIGYQGGELVEDESMMEATPAGMMEENIEEVQGEPSREQLEAIAFEIFRLPLEELDEQQLMVVYQAAMEQEPSEEEVQFAAQEGPGEGIASLV